MKILTLVLGRENQPQVQAWAGQVITSRQRPEDESQKLIAGSHWKFRSLGPGGGGGPILSPKSQSLSGGSLQGQKAPSLRSGVCKTESLPLISKLDWTTG